MRRIIVIGSVLIVFGLLGLIFPRVTYSKNTTAVELGPIEVQAKEKRSIPIPEVAAGASLVAGVVLVIAGAGRRR